MNQTVHAKRLVTDNRFWHWLHHHLLVEHFKALDIRSGKFWAVLYTNQYESIAMRHQPRIGERTWIAENGRPYDSSEIKTVLDKHDFGY
jgi:hypothetical protein